MKRYQRSQPIPDRLFVAGIDVTRDQKEFCFFALRLPSWGHGYDICCDELRWGQRVLRYHGSRGFSIGWRFPSKSHSEITGLER